MVPIWQGIEVMGSYYTNVAVKGPTQDRVLTHLRERGRDAPDGVDLTSVGKTER